MTAAYRAMTGAEFKACYEQARGANLYTEIPEPKGLVHTKDWGKVGGTIENPLIVHDKDKVKEWLKDNWREIVSESGEVPDGNEYSDKKGEPVSVLKFRKPGETDLRGHWLFYWKYDSKLLRKTAEDIRKANNNAGAHPIGKSIQRKQHIKISDYILTKECLMCKKVDVFDGTCTDHKSKPLYDCVCGWAAYCSLDCEQRWERNTEHKASGLCVPLVPELLERLRTERALRHQPRLDPHYVSAWSITHFPLTEQDELVLCADVLIKARPPVVVSPPLVVSSSSSPMAETKADPIVEAAVDSKAEEEVPPQPSFVYVKDRKGSIDAYLAKLNLKVKHKINGDILPTGETRVMVSAISKDTKEDEPIVHTIAFEFVVNATLAAKREADESEAERLNPPPPPLTELAKEVLYDAEVATATVMDPKVAMAIEGFNKDIKELKYIPKGTGIIPSAPVTTSEEVKATKTAHDPHNMEIKDSTKLTPLYVYRKDDEEGKKATEKDTDIQMKEIEEGKRPMPGTVDWPIPYTGSETPQAYIEGPLEEGGAGMRITGQKFFTNKRGHQVYCYSIWDPRNGTSSNMYFRPLGRVCQNVTNCTNQCLDVVVCERCQDSVYCSEACLKAAHPRHVVKCDVLKEYRAMRAQYEKDNKKKADKKKAKKKTGTSVTEATTSVTRKLAK